MISFRDWIAKHNVTDDGLVDAAPYTLDNLAYDITNDTDFPKSNLYDDIRSYLIKRFNEGTYRTLRRKYIAARELPAGLSAHLDALKASIARDQELEGLMGIFEKAWGMYLNEA